MARAPTQYRPQISAEAGFPRIGVVRPRMSPTPDLMGFLGRGITEAAVSQAARDEDEAVRRARYEASQVPLTAESILLSGDDKFKNLKLQGTLSLGEQKAFDRASTAYHNTLQQRVSQMNQKAYSTAIDGLSRAADGDVEAYMKGVDEFRRKIGGVDLSTPDGAFFASAVTAGQNNVAVARANDERRQAEITARENIDYAFNFGSPEDQKKALEAATALNIDVRSQVRTGKTNNALAKLREKMAGLNRDDLRAQQKAVNDSWPAFAEAYGLPKSAQTAALRVLNTAVETINNVDRDASREESNKQNELLLDTEANAAKVFSKILQVKDPTGDIRKLGEMIQGLTDKQEKITGDTQAAIEGKSEREKAVIFRHARTRQAVLGRMIDRAYRLIKMEQGELSDLLKIFADDEINIAAGDIASEGSAKLIRENLLKLKELNDAQKTLPKDAQLDPEEIARVSRRWSALQRQAIQARKDGNYARQRFTSSNTQYSSSPKDQKASELYLNAFRAIETDVLIDHLNPGFGDPAVVGYNPNTGMSLSARTTGSQLAQEFMMGARNELGSVDREYHPEINALITMQGKAVPAPMAALIDSLEGNAIPVDPDGRAKFENVVQFMSSLKAQGFEADTFKKLGMSTLMIDRADQYMRHMRYTQFSDQQLTRDERSAAALSMMTERESQAFGKGVAPDLKEIFDATTSTNTPAMVARDKANEIIREVTGSSDVPADLVGIVAQKLMDTAGRTGDLERAIHFTTIDLTGVIGESELGRSMTADPTSDARSVSLYPPESLARKYRNHNDKDDFGQNLADYANQGIRSFVEQHYPEYSDKLGKSVFLRFDLARNQYFLFEGASGLGSDDITVGAYRPQYLSDKNGGLIEIPVDSITKEANIRFQMRRKELQAGEFKDLKDRMDRLRGDNRELMEVFMSNAELAHKSGHFEQRNKMLRDARALARRAGLPVPNPSFPVPEDKEVEGE